MIHMASPNPYDMRQVERRRQAQGVPLSRLCRDAKVNYATVTKHGGVDGETLPIRSALKLAKALGFTPEEIMVDDGAAPPRQVVDPTATPPAEGRRRRRRQQQKKAG